MDQMSETEQADVRSSVDHIARRFDPSRVMKVSRSRPGQQPFFYVLQATPDLRVFFERTDDRVRVLDVINAAAWESFGGQPGPTPR